MASDGPCMFWKTMAHGPIVVCARRIVWDCLGLYRIVYVTLSHRFAEFWPPRCTNIAGPDTCTSVVSNEAAAKHTHTC